MTDEYTPTTEQVRDVALLGAIDAAGGEDYLDAHEFLAMFDRWLAGVRADQREKDAQTAHDWATGHPKNADALDLEAAIRNHDVMTDLERPYGGKRLMIHPQSYAIPQRTEAVARAAEMDAGVVMELHSSHTEFYANPEVPVGTIVVYGLREYKGLPEYQTTLLNPDDPYNAHVWPEDIPEEEG